MAAQRGARSHEKAGEDEAAAKHESHLCNFSDNNVLSANVLCCRQLRVQCQRSKSRFEHSHISNVSIPLAFFLSVVSFLIGRESNLRAMISYSFGFSIVLHLDLVALRERKMCVPPSAHSSLCSWKFMNFEISSNDFLLSHTSEKKSINE